MKRVLAMILALLLLTSSICSCGSTEETSSPDTASQNSGDTSVTETEVETEAEETEEPEPLYIDTLPNTDFGGRTFSIGAPAAYNLEPEELTREAINDAVYEQMIQTEDKFNVDVVRVDVASLAASVQANDDSYHIVSAGTSGGASSYALSGLVQNLYNFDDIDFTQPWWNQHTVEELSLGGKMYMAFGDIFAERGITYIHSFFFNKKLAEDYDLNKNIQTLYGEDNIYNLVRNSKWTIDALETLISGVSVDVDGDGEMTFNDMYGLGQSIPVSGVYRTAFDCEIMARGEDGYPVLNINTDKFNAIVPRIYSLCFENPAVLMGEHAEETLLGQTFVAGRLLFYSGFLCDVNTLREMEDEFGVLPFPKYDEAQTDYLTTVRGDNYFLCIPVTVKGDEEVPFVGLVTESLAYYGYTMVRPAVYDETLKGKMTRDEDSLEMLDILTNGIVIEFAFAHAHNSGFSYVLWNLLDARMNSFASYYQKKEKAAFKYYEQLNENYRELD